MRRLCSLVLLFVSVSPLAQTPAPSAATTPPVSEAGPPRSTIPSDSNERARPAWYASCRDRVAEANAHPEAHVDVMFVGDSITEGWTSAAWGGVDRGAAVWAKMYATRHALNFGVGADSTQNVLYRLNTMDVQRLTPRVVVLLIGTNNARDTPPDIAAGVHAILMRLESMYPAARIILVSILPNARATERMADANALIRPFADDRTVFYLDLVPRMPPVGDNWTGLGPDKLHPSAVGYQIWADAMEPLLTRLLATPPK